MGERINCGPRVAIFDSRSVLLHESTGTTFGDGSLKHVINTLRVVQREVNEFLTKLVNEQTLNSAGKNESAAVDTGKKKETKITFSRPLCCTEYHWPVLVSFFHHLEKLIRKCLQL
jgi:hypothetical protein